jgi:hypothetical protein
MHGLMRQYIRTEFYSPIIGNLAFVTFFRVVLPAKADDGIRLAVIAVEIVETFRLSLG